MESPTSAAQNSAALTVTNNWICYLATVVVLLLCCLPSGCGQRVAVVVDVSGIPERAASLQAFTTLNGISAREQPVFPLPRNPPRSLRLGLHFDYPFPRLPIQITIGAFDEKGCLMAVDDTMPGEEIPTDRAKIAELYLDATLTEPLKRPPCGSTSPLIVSLEPESMYGPISLRPEGQSITLTGWGFSQEMKVVIAGEVHTPTLQSFTMATVAKPRLPLSPGAVPVALSRAGEVYYVGNEHLEVKLAPVRWRWDNVASASGDQPGLWLDWIAVDLNGDGAEEAVALDAHGTLWAFGMPALGGTSPLPGLTRLARIESIPILSGNSARIVPGELDGSPGIDLLVVSTAGCVAMANRSSGEQLTLNPLWTDAALRGDAGVLLDVDHDGIEDLVLLRSRQEAATFKGQRGSLFASTPMRQEKGDFREIAAANLDGLGIPELLLIRPVLETDPPDSPDLLIWRNGWGEAIEQPYRLFPCSPPPTFPGLLFKDLDGDGAVDIVASSTAMFLQNRLRQPSGDFKPIYIDGLSACGEPESPMAAADLNGDRLTDIIWLHENGLRIVLGQRFGQFSILPAGKQGTESSVISVAFSRMEVGLAMPGPRRLPVSETNGRAAILLGQRWFTSLGHEP